MDECSAPGHVTNVIEHGELGKRTQDLSDVWRRWGDAREPVPKCSVFGIPRMSVREGVEENGFDHVQNIACDRRMEGDPFLGTMLPQCRNRLT